MHQLPHAPYLAYYGKDIKKYIWSHFLCMHLPLKISCEIFPLHCCNLLQLGHACQSPPARGIKPHSHLLWSRCLLTLPGSSLLINSLWLNCRFGSLGLCLHCWVWFAIQEGAGVPDPGGYVSDGSGGGRQGVDVLAVSPCQEWLCRLSASGPLNFRWVLVLERQFDLQIKMWRVRACDFPGWPFGDFQYHLAQLTKLQVNFLLPWSPVFLLFLLSLTAPPS